MHKRVTFTDVHTPLDCPLVQIRASLQSSDAITTNTSLIITYERANPMGHERSNTAITATPTTEDELTSVVLPR